MTGKTGNRFVVCHMCDRRFFPEESPFGKVCSRECSEMFGQVIGLNRGHKLAREAARMREYRRRHPEYRRRTPEEEHLRWREVHPLLQKICPCCGEWFVPEKSNSQQLCSRLCKNRWKHKRAKLTDATARRKKRRRQRERKGLLALEVLKEMGVEI